MGDNLRSNSEEAASPLLRERTVAPSKADVVAESLAQLIVGKGLESGNYLASENDLSQHYGVSRPNVRQALYRLAAAGLVETRHGVGTYVTPERNWNLFDPMILHAFIASGNLAAIADELVQLRRMVEIEAAGLAASNISADGERQLSRYLARMHAALDDVRDVTEADLSFHDVILAGSGNRFFQGIMRFLHEPLSRARHITMDAGGPDGRRRAYDHHVAIRDAIADHDPQAARAAMKAHMQQLEEDIKSAFHSLGGERA